jgi:hypothetical protein
MTADYTFPPSRRPQTPASPPPIRRKSTKLTLWLALAATIVLVVVLIILFWPDDDPEQESTAANEAASSSAPGESGAGDSGRNSDGNASVERPAANGEDGSAGSSGAGPAKFDAPAQALEEARAKYGMAQNQLAQGNAGDATASVIEAWEIASQFPDDPGCAEFAGKLLPEIQSLSKRANEKFQRQVERDETPLIEQ